MKKWVPKGMALLMSIALLTSLCVPALAVDGYEDVPEEKYYAKNLETLTNAGIIQEDGELFLPDEGCTRAVFVTWLWRLAGSPAATSTCTLSDVESGQEYTEAVTWAWENGVVKGYYDGSFGINHTVTRAQMVTFLYRFAKQQGKTGVDQRADLSGYPDVNELPDHATESMAWAVAVGVLQGTTDGKLNPNGQASRAHAVAFVGRLEEATHEHTWDSGKVTKSATCTRAGVRTYTCTGCGETKTESIAKKGHRWGEWQDNGDGTHIRYCSRNSSHIQTAAHSYTDDADTDCNTCGHGRVVHTCGDGAPVAGQAATCTVDGWEDYYQCSCEKFYADEACTYVIEDLEAWKNGAGKIAADPTGSVHTYGNLIEAQDAVHTQSELKGAVAAHYFCDACDTYFTAGKEATTLEALTGVVPEHDTAVWVNTDPDQHWKKCSVCGLEDAQKADHAWGEWALNDGAYTHTCGVCRQTQVLTREDLEEALVETAWGYFLKGSKVQYDGGNLTEISAMNGGARRPTLVSTLEDATEDNAIYTVCSDYCWSVYQQTLGLPLMGDRRNSSTYGLWWLSDAYGMTVARWKGDAYNTGDTKDDKATAEMYGVDFTKVKTTEEMKAFITNYEENLRPGDIMLFYGHAMLYIGDGYVLDSGGTTYKMDLGVESIEAAGTVDYLHPSVVDIYVNGVGDTGVNYKLDSQPERYMVIVRPLNALCGTDDDTDPANDPFNAGYTLPEFSDLMDGVNLLYHKDAKLSDYMITDATQSRLQYPAMEIDRTVDITQYGTAIQGGTLTYSVKVSNKSDNESYCTYQSAVRGATYTGEDYTGLVVTETIPEGTVLVAGSISANGVYDEQTNTITWTIGVEAGETVECAYTVNVTGNIGNVITNGGGMVADIPSNTISNTIGGAKLADVKVEALEKFYDDGVTKFAENGVGATRLDTEFATRVYQAVLGIDLVMPTSQELLDNLFDRKTIYSANKYMSGYDTETLFQAYVLKDAEDVAAGYEDWYKMLVANYIGGTQVWTDFENGETRINQFSSDYLELGDILIYGNLEGSNSVDLARKVTETKVLVYVGGDKFVSMTTEGMPEVSEGAALNLWSAFSYDFLFALRPSQKYADINGMAYTGGATYEAEFRSVAPYEGLTPENEQAFAALTEVNNKNNVQVIGIAYDKLGIDIANDLVVAGGKTVTYASAMDTVFFQQTAESVVDKQEGYRYELRATAPAGNEKMFSMLVDGWYGGRLVETASSRTDFSLSTLKIGDALVLGTRNTVNGLRAYWVALYQGYDEGTGKGKFLIAKLDDTAKKDDSNTYTETVYYSADEFQTQVLNKQITYTDADGNPQTIAHWQSWFLLRPSQAYDNINQIGGIVPNVSALSLANQAKLESIKSGEMSAITETELAFATAIYKKMGLDISAEIGDTTAIETAANGVIFTKDSDGKYTLCTEDNTTNPALLSMLVDGWYGGKKVNNAPAKTNHTLDNLQAGDVLVMGRYDGGSTWKCKTYVFTTSNATKNSAEGLVCFAYQKMSKESWLKTTMLESDLLDIVDGSWEYYYLIRPSQAYGDINSEALISTGLSAENQTALAGVTPEEDDITQAYLALVTEAYEAIGLNISAEIGTGASNKPSVSEFMQGMVFTRKKTDGVIKYTICNSENTKNPTLFAMLVDGWYGGANVVDAPANTGHKLASLQVGDALVLGNIDDVGKNNKKGDYAVYVYQGAGQFLRYRRGLDIAQETLDEVGFAALLANETDVGTDYYTGKPWQCYALIRPSQAFANINEHLALTKTGATIVELVTTTNSGT